MNVETPPPIEVTHWLNADTPPSLEALKGKVVVVCAFQMLCPGCVSHGLPQAQRIRERFAPGDVAVLGLHTVFEHHDVMTQKALEAFLHEYRFPFPVGIDKPNGKGIPTTMLAYEMRGTPTLLVFDREGRLRRHYFGRADDMTIGAELMGLIVETDSRRAERTMHRALITPGHDHGHQHGDNGCETEGCGCH